MSGKKGPKLKLTCGDCLKKLSGIASHLGPGWSWWHFGIGNHSNNGARFGDSNPAALLHGQSI